MGKALRMRRPQARGYRFCRIEEAVKGQPSGWPFFIALRNARADSCRRHVMRARVVKTSRAKKNILPLQCPQELFP
jgi:hypothetical protein